MASNSWQQLVNTDPRGISADGLTLATFTTSAPIFPAIVLPANYLGGRDPNRMLHFKARGIWAATATPTYTFRLQATAPTPTTLVTSAAIAVTALTNQAWEWEMRLQTRTLGTAGTVMVAGDLGMAGVTGQQWLPAAGTAPATAALDTTVAQTIQLEIACSASSASNTVKGIMLEVTSFN